MNERIIPSIVLGTSIIIGMLIYVIATRFVIVASNPAYSSDGSSTSPCYLKMNRITGTMSFIVDAIEHPVEKEMPARK